MARQCTVCAHEKRNEIDEALILGRESFAQIAHRFALSSDSLKRHKAAHISAKQTAVIEKVEAKLVKKEAGSIATQIADIVERTRNLLDRAEARDDDKMMLAAVRELRPYFELMLKLSGELDESSKVQVNNLVQIQMVWPGSDGGTDGPTV